MFCSFEEGYGVAWEPTYFYLFGRVHAGDYSMPSTPLTKVAGYLEAQRVTWHVGRVTWRPCLPGLSPTPPSHYAHSAWRVGFPSTLVPPAQQHNHLMFTPLAALLIYEEGGDPLPLSGSWDISTEFKEPRDYLIQRVSIGKPELTPRP